MGLLPVEHSPDRLGTSFSVVEGKSTGEGGDGGGVGDVGSGWVEKEVV